jgi:hypothetical protein
LLDEETKEKPENLARDYGDLCLVADGFAQVYPEHKYLIVECLRDMGYVSSDMAWNKVAILFQGSHLTYLIINFCFMCRPLE